MKDYVVTIKSTWADSKYSHDESCQYIIRDAENEQTAIERAKLQYKFGTDPLWSHDISNITDIKIREVRY